MEVLHHLRITSSQIHQVARIVVKVFKYWCEYWGGVSTLKLFLNIFHVTRTYVREEQGQGFLLLHHSKKVFDVYLDKWKSLNNHYFLVTPQSQEAHSTFCVLPKDNHSLSCLIVQSRPNVETKFENDGFGTTYSSLKKSMHFPLTLLPWRKEC